MKTPPANTAKLAQSGVLPTFRRRCILAAIRTTAASLLLAGSVFAQSPTISNAPTTGAMHSDRGPASEATTTSSAGGNASAGSAAARWSGPLNAVAGPPPSHTTEDGGTADAASVEEETAADQTERSIFPSEAFSGIWRTVLGLAIIIALAFVVRALVRRTAGPLAGVRSPGGVVEVLARYPFGRGHALTLLRVGRRIILLSQHQGAVTTLSEFNDAEDVADLLCRIEVAGGASFSQRLQSLVDGEQVRERKTRGTAHTPRTRGKVTVTHREATTQPGVTSTSVPRLTTAKAAKADAATPNVAALQRLLDERRVLADVANPLTRPSGKAGTQANSDSRRSGATAGEPLPEVNVTQRASARGAVASPRGAGKLQSIEGGGRA